MKNLLAIVPLIFTPYVVACEDIQGSYKSVSETHWSFELNIEGEKAVLTYKDYISGTNDTRTDMKTVSQGNCAKTSNGYELVFADKKFPVQYDSSLSTASFGGEGNLPGIVGEFLNGHEVMLWNGI